MNYSQLLKNFDNGATTGAAGIVYNANPWSHGSFQGRYADRGDARMFVENETVYSYGYHFPMAIRREFGSNVRFMINGDRSSHTTNDHVRMCITQLTPNVQIPFSALNAAGVEPGEINIVAYDQDRWFDVCLACGRETFEDSSDEYRDKHEGDKTDVCARTGVCARTDDLSSTSHEHVLGAVLFERAGKFFLSSTDPQEGMGRGYFLCQLPGEVKSVSEALDSLKPEYVRRAEQFGREIRRQGDVFFVESEVTTRELVATPEKRVRLFETSHVVTEAKQNGNLYVRGTVRHDPQDGRRPEHKMLRLGKNWWVPVKNTSLGGWSAIGNID